MLLYIYGNSSSFFHHGFCFISPGGTTENSWDIRSIQYMPSGRIGSSVVKLWWANPFLYDSCSRFPFHRPTIGIWHILLKIFRICSHEDYNSIKIFNDIKKNATVISRIHFAQLLLGKTLSDVKIFQIYEDASSLMPKNADAFFSSLLLLRKPPSLQRGGSENLLHSLWLSQKGAPRRF